MVYAFRNNKKNARFFKKNTQKTHKKHAFLMKKHSKNTFFLRKIVQKTIKNARKYTLKTCFFMQK